MDLVTVIARASGGGVLLRGEVDEAAGFEHILGLRGDVRVVRDQAIRRRRTLQPVESLPTPVTSRTS